MENLNEACYAYPALKKYPIHTKEAAEDSYGLYSRQRAAIPEIQRHVIEGNFEKAAKYHGIQLEKTASEAPIPREKLSFTGSGDQHIDMNEITSIDELHKAAQYIIEKRASTPRSVLAEPAKYVLWSLSNTNQDMNTDEFRKIAHIAGIGVGDREKIQYELEKRAAINMLSEKDGAALWKFAREVKELTDDEFYREDNLNTICNTIDSVDFYCNQQHKHASELGYPEDVVFSDTMDDMIKDASDLYYVPSIDATLSKKATLERKDTINHFLAVHFGQKEPLDGDALFEKVASLDENVANALIDSIE